MSSLNKILIPFDFSEASVNALEYVVNFVGTEKSIGIVGLYVGAMPISASDNEKLGKDFFKVLESFEVPFGLGECPRPWECPNYHL